MKTEIVGIEDSKSVSRASALLHAGGIVAFPTDTVYGIAASARKSHAILRLYQAKMRPRELSIPVLIATQHQLIQVVTSVPEFAQRLANEFWPGPITLVLNRDPSLPAELGPDKTIGIRMPNHAFVLRLIHDVGPLAVTSANRSGDRSPTIANDVILQLGGTFELLIDGGQTSGQVSSTVVDCTGTKPSILREGPISEDEINQFLAD